MARGTWAVFRFPLSTWGSFDGDLATALDLAGGGAGLAVDQAGRLLRSSRWGGMYGVSSSPRTLALQLERLTREAAGFKTKMAAVSSENTRLKRELAERSAAAKRDAVRIRRLEASLSSASSELTSAKEQRDADARRDADERMETDANTARLQQELKDARRELAAKNRWLASHEHVGELRDRQLYETSSVRNAYDLELTQLRAAYAARTQELSNEEGQRRRAEGEVAACRAAMSELESKMAGLTRDLSLAKTTMQRQRAALDERDRTIQQMCEADPSLGAYGDLIGNAAATIRMMSDSQFFEDSVRPLDETTADAEEPASVVPEACPPSQLQQRRPQVHEEDQLTARGGADISSSSKLRGVGGDGGGKAAEQKTRQGSDAAASSARVHGQVRYKKKNNSIGGSSRRVATSGTTKSREHGAKPTAGLPATKAGSYVMEMVCPDGVGAGDVISITAGDGVGRTPTSRKAGTKGKKGQQGAGNCMLEIEIPEGISAGMAFSVLVEGEA